MTVCGNCFHKRSFHKKVDGSAWCTLTFCACKQFIEAEIDFNRQAMHAALDQFINDFVLRAKPDKTAGADSSNSEKSDT